MNFLHWLTSSLNNGAAQKRFLMAPKRATAIISLKGLRNLNNFSAPSSYFVWSVPLDPKQIVHQLLTTADKYRQFARWIGDHETVRRILALTDELKQRARTMANPEEAKIRNRAREIWEDNGRPAGRDEEFWFQAEREFREAEDIAKRSSADA